MAFFVSFDPQLNNLNIDLPVFGFVVGDVIAVEVGGDFSFGVGVPDNTRNLIFTINGAQVGTTAKRRGAKRARRPAATRP